MIAAISVTTMPQSMPTARSAASRIGLPVSRLIASVQWYTDKSSTATPTLPTPIAMRRRELRTGLFLRAFFNVAGLALLLVALAFVGMGLPFRDGTLRVCIWSISEVCIEPLTSSVSCLGSYLALQQQD